MIQIFLMMVLMGSSKPLDPCQPQTLLREEGIWDGQRFVRVDHDGFQVSDDGHLWRTVSPLPVPSIQTNELETNGSVYLWSIGYDGFFASRDLLQWEKMDFVRPELIWNGHQWLSYGFGNFRVSADGFNWSQAVYINTYFSSMVWFKDKYVGTATTLMNSVDGLNWERQSIVADKLEVVGDRIIALKGKQIWISDDGINWQGGAVVTNSLEIRSVAYNGRLYVARGDASLLTSTDGLNWSEQAAPYNMFQVRSMGDGFYSTGRVYLSTDGLTWEDQGFEAYGKGPVVNGTVYLQNGYIKNGQAYQYMDKYASITYVNGLYAAVWLNYLYTSTNGIGWRQLQFDTQKIYYNEALNRWECFEDQIRNTSTDGVHWVAETVPGMSNQVELAHNRYFFENKTSTDGFNWVESSDYVKQVYWAEGHYFALSGTQHVRSSNAIDWHPTGLNMSNHKIWELNGVLMTGGMISVDQGEQWFQPLSDLAGLRSVGVFSGHFIGFGSKGLLYSSTDGILWSKQETGNTLNDIYINAPDLLMTLDRDESINTIPCMEGTPIEPAIKVVYPWVVANHYWFSRLGLMNDQQIGVLVRLEAEDQAGNTQTHTAIIPGNGLFTKLASELFPGLNGYSVAVYSSARALYPILTTFNENPVVGTRSPAEAEGSLIGDLTDELLFAYLPGEDVPAIALENMAPNAAEIQVIFSLIDEQGTIIAEAERTLIGKRPFASTVSDLFPDVSLPQSACVRAKGPQDAWLSGLTFDFNRQGQPAMDRALNLYSP